MDANAVHSDALDKKQEKGLCSLGNTRSEDLIGPAKDTVIADDRMSVVQSSKEASSAGTEVKRHLNTLEALDARHTLVTFWLKADFERNGVAGKNQESSEEFQARSFDVAVFTTACRVTDN